jgi:hypothetical protein
VDLNEMLYLEKWIKNDGGTSETLEITFFSIFKARLVVSMPITLRSYIAGG